MCEIVELIGSTFCNFTGNIACVILIFRDLDEFGHMFLSYNILCENNGV